jgi:hypothetical protein
MKKNIYLFVIVLLLASVFLRKSHAINHNYPQWENIVQEYTSSQRDSNLFNYKKLKRNQDNFLRTVEKIEVVSIPEFNKWTRNQKSAYLINAYNILSINRVLVHYPIQNIRTVRDFKKRYFRDRVFTILGQKRSLQDIRKKLIEITQEDLRLVCILHFPGQHTPRLMSVKATKLSQRLDQACHHYFNFNPVNQVRSQKKALILSERMLDFADTFPKNPPRQLVQRYVNRDLSGYEIVYQTHEWQINHR